MKLRFYARGTALVSDFDALDRPVPLRRFIGRRYTEITPDRWGFAPSGEADEVSARPEVIKAAIDGELWPADEATATVRHEIDATASHQLGIEGT